MPASIVQQTDTEHAQRAQSEKLQITNKKKRNNWAVATGKRASISGSSRAPAIASASSSKWLRLSAWKWVGGCVRVCVCDDLHEVVELKTLFCYIFFACFFHFDLNVCPLFGNLVVSLICCWWWWCCLRVHEKEKFDKNAANQVDEMKLFKNASHDERIGEKYRYHTHIPFVHLF